MSTRAIFAKELSDGTFVGGWQWNDGGNYTPSELNRKFSKEKDVDDLIAIGEWRVIFSKKQKEEHERWYSENITNGRKLKWKQISGNFVLLDSWKVRQANKLNGFCQPCVYKNIEEMLGQDINYLYVFSNKTHKWKKYR